MASTKERLAALREYIKGISANKTTFIVEGGAEFYTDLDAFEYLRYMEHIRRTGSELCCILTPWRVDGLPVLYEMLDEAIKLDGLNFQTESDDMNEIKPRLRRIRDYVNGKRGKRLLVLFRRLMERK
ncbi:MAG: hypothetical protein ACLSBB_16105 [Ruthenibacterium lactatiformans]